MTVAQQVSNSTRSLQPNEACLVFFRAQAAVQPVRGDLRAGGGLYRSWYQQQSAGVYGFVVNGLGSERTHSCTKPEGKICPSPPALLGVS